ncbi:hypothetical protein FHT08_003781 [Xanthomonas campestris]|uniref:hypothetical protein n=1 Tax=Xanthomonas sp. CFBP 8151 TaxID=3035310 RepID=UPI00141A757A|nr:hypothetical protein [Xanthomonas sp. CFBP 8151]NIJ78640.1 hypothetical protein [Xanthomonas sp. CFBP 8151]
MPNVELYPVKTWPDLERLDFGDAQEASNNACRQGDVSALCQDIAFQQASADALEPQLVKSNDLTAAQAKAKGHESRKLTHA